jgi:hypothetical protein
MENTAASTKSLKTALLLGFMRIHSKCVEIRYLLCQFGCIINSFRRLEMAQSRLAAHPNRGAGARGCRFTCICVSTIFKLTGSSARTSTSKAFGRMGQYEIESAYNRENKSWRECNVKSAAFGTFSDPTAPFSQAARALCAVER